MKKVENTRSHSWWWDSHISPKNSKWLQENLSEMDSKVSAMLRIIEEDADSFAQRAEMFYKKRPELINLVEEFYRTYRALVERYTYLTREIRQNIAPALQAQLGVSSESAQNSPVDVHSKRGIIDGPDIISPSYSYTGASEFDYDSPTAVSIKGQTDDEFSPLGFQTNYERRAFGFKSTFLNLEESSPKLSESGMVQGTVDACASQLQKELLRLQEENKELSMKATEDVTKLKNLQLELSSLQSRLRSLEAEDKLTKKRLKSVQEKEQKLEAENLKFSHALISLKEERTELLEQQKKLAEDIRVAYQKNELLEKRSEGLREELLEAQSQHLESSGNFKRSEEVVQKLELTLTTLKEDRLKDLFLMEIYEQQSQDSLKKISDLEKKNAGLTEQSSVQIAEVQKLQEQLTNVLENTRALEQALHATTHEKTCTELEKSVALSQVKNYQEKVEEAKKEREQQAAEISRLMGIICKLEEEGQRALSEKLESAKYVHKLEASLDDGQRFKETLLASCQQYEDKCKALELKYTESNEKLLSRSQEMSRLQHQVQALEDMVISSQLQSKELQEKVSSIVVENKSLMDELQNAIENVKVAEGQCAEMLEITKDQKEEIEGLQKDLVQQLDSTRRLEEELLHVAKEKAALVEKKTETLMAYQQLENEHTTLKQELELKLALTEDINHKLSCLEMDKSELVLESQKLQQNLLELQTVNEVLSSNCLTNNKGLQAAQKEVRKTQKELASSLLEVEKLKEDGHAKGELLRKMESDFESMEACLTSYTEENSLLSKEVNKCSKNLAAIETENNDLKSRLSDVVTLSTALAEQVSEKERSIKWSTNELAVAQRQVVALNEDIASKTSQTLDLQQQISSLEKQLELECAELQESSLVKQTLETVVEGLQLENSETKIANKALRHEQQGLLSDILTLKSFNQDLEANLSQVKRENTSLQEDVITLTNQCIDLKQRIASLEFDCGATQCESATLRDQLAESEKEIMSSSKKLFKAEGRVQDLQLRLTNMLAEEASLAEQLAERIGKIHILETALLEMQKENKTLTEDVGLLQQQILALRTQDDSLLVEMHESSELIQHLSTERDRLQQVVINAEEAEKRLSLEHRKDLEECLLLQQKIDNLQQDLEICVEEKVIFLKDATSHLERSNELECEVKRLEAEKSHLQQELFRAQQVEHRLKEDLEKLIEERQELSGTLDFQKKKIEKQEEDLLSLQGVISCTKEGQQILIDTVNLLTEEKTALLQVLKNNKQESERTRELCLKLQTDISHLQKVTTTTEAELSNTMKELRVLQETTWSLQVAKTELEQKLESCSRQALLQEDKEMRVLEMLTAAQEENLKLELDLDDAQKKIFDTNGEFDRQRKVLEGLKQELAAVVMVKEELEQELVELQEEKTTCHQKLDKMHQDYRCLKEQKNQSDFDLEAAISQGQENASKLSSLQEQLLSARNLKLEMAGTDDWVATERELQEEILQLTSASFQQKNELELQYKRVLELEEEVCQLQAEKGALQSDTRLNKKQISDLQQQVGDLKTQLSDKQMESSKLSSQAEPLSTKENIDLELQRQVQLFMEENNQLVRKLQNSDRDLVQIKDNFHMQESRLHELWGRLCESESENKLKELSCQAQAEESALIKEENTELTDALSKTQAQNARLEAKLAAEAAALVSVKHELSALQEEKAEEMAKAFMHESQVADLHDSFLKVQGEFETGKNWADNATEEAICLQTDQQAAHLQVLKLSKNRCELVQQEELTSEIADNNKLVRMVSDEALIVMKLQEEVSNLQNGRQGLESAIQFLKGQLEEAEKAREETLYTLHDCSKEFLQMIFKIEDLDKMLCDNLEGKLDCAMQLEENLSVYRKEHADLPQTVLSPESGKQSLLPEVFAAGRVIKKPFTFPEDSLGSCILQSASRLPGDSMKMEEESVSSSWTFDHVQQRLSDAMDNKLDRMKENILFLLNRHQAQVLSSTNEQQEQVSKLQEEIEHLILEVKLYRKETFYLKNVLQGEDLQAEGEVAHEDVRVLLVMVHNLQDNLVASEEKVRELKEELRREIVKRRSLQLMLTDLEVQGHSYMLLLKRNLFLSCKRLRELAIEWNERACDRESNQIAKSIEKLSRAEALCNGSNSQDEDYSGCKEEGTCQQPEASQPTGACTLLLGQLQRRVEEFSLLSEAVKDMLPPIHWQDQREDGNKQGACGTFKESKDNLLMVKINHSLLHQEQHQQSGVSKEDVSEFDNQLVDSAGANTREGDESEIVETVPLDQKEIELIEGLAQLRIDLGMRLHQALMDEKLENELLELKEEREKLKDDLQAQVEQVQRMEAELEKLQVFIKGESVEGEVLDPKQQQQWLQRRKKAEKRARKLSRELVLQRQHVGKMHETVVAWTEQQELATEILEKQVLLLVSKECAPTMDGWDSHHVTQLMQEMQSRKALARRHSMDLQSVEEDLQRVGCSIESTQRQLLEDKQKQQASLNRISRKNISVNAASDTVKNHWKLSRLGLGRYRLTWLLLLISTRGRGLSERNPDDTTSATAPPPKQVQRHQTSSSIALNSFLAQTRKMRCCGRAPKSDRRKSLDEKK